MKEKEIAVFGAVLLLGFVSVRLLSRTGIFGSGVFRRRSRRGGIPRGLRRRLLLRPPARRPGISQNITYTLEDLRATCLSLMCKRISRKVLHRIFKADTATRGSNEPLTGFYRRRGVNIKSGMTSPQKRLIDNDPEGDSFDVTLLCRCLRNGGSQVLANEADVRWNEEDNGTLESLINFIKKKRNHLAHEDPKYSSSEFQAEAKKLRRVLIELLSLAGQPQNFGLPPDEVNAAIADVNADCNKYLQQGPDIITFLLCDSVSNEGKEEVQDQYAKIGITKVEPNSERDDVSFEVEDIFTEMKLREGSKIGQKKTVQYEDLLLDNTPQKKNSVILIEGRAGVGKTTLVKKILNEWMSQTPSSIKELDNYTLVLHSECRHPTVESYTDILKRLMPDFLKRSNDDAITVATLSHKNLVILDGLDEVNPSSKRLFRAMLELTRDNAKVTVIITTRPEKRDYYYANARSLNIKTKHVQLLGVPQKRRDEFIIKYHRELKKTNPNIPLVEGLLEFLGRGGHRHQELWRLPFNLTALVLIWEYNTSDINIITTSIELYWQTYMHHRVKLKDRLTACMDILYIDDDQIEHSMITLGREALLGLISDNINLSGKSYQRLKSDCIKRGIPHEEVTGAFLKKVFTTPTILGFHVIFSYPHKGIQDFLGALYIFKELEKVSRRHRTNSIQEDEITSDDSPSFSDISEQSDDSSSLSNSSDESVISSSTKSSEGWDNWSDDESPSVVRNLLERLHGSKPLEMEKYQNLFSILIGLMHLQPGRISDSMKTEVLKILQESGIRTKSEWLRILDDTKCDHFVASFISQKTQVLRGTIKIRDSTINAYNSLLSAFQSPLETTERIMVIVDVKEEFFAPWNYLLTKMDFHHLHVRMIKICHENIQNYISLLKNPPQSFQPMEQMEAVLNLRQATVAEIEELLDQLNRRNVQVAELDLDTLFKQGALSPLLKEAIAEILRRCWRVKSYTGPMMEELLQMEDELDTLFVSINDRDSFFLLRDYLINPEHRLTFLAFCVPLTIDIQILEPISGQVAYGCGLLLPDVTSEEDIRVACDITRRVHPIPEGDQYHKVPNVCFPRAQLNNDGIKRLLEGLDANGVMVDNYILFPSVLRPSLPEDEAAIAQLANDVFGPDFRVLWGMRDSADEHSMYDMDSW